MKIDYEKIGKNMYNMMPEDDQALVAFGMIDIKYHTILEKQLRSVIADKHKNQLGFEKEDDSSILDQFVKSDIISKIISKICVEIYAEANKQDKMLC